MEHPDQLERLRNDPSLIRSAVEELLRFGAPVETATERFAREDVELGGVTIRKGELVFAAIASANRDERQFPNPDVLDITREPNRHLAFGQGIHFCLGASLARLESQIAINQLLARTSDLRLKVPTDKLVWRGGLVLRSLRRCRCVYRGARSGRRGLSRSHSITASSAACGAGARVDTRRRAVDDQSQSLRWAANALGRLGG